MKIKAIIFDMDGVLIDAKEWHFDALNKALSIFGYSIDRYKHLFTYDGLPTKEKLKMLSEDNDLPIGLHSLIHDLKQKYTLDIAYQKSKNSFDQHLTLSKLKKEKYKLAVASNSIKSTISFLLSKAGIIDYFDFYLSNQDVEKSKPDPEIYLKAINRLNFKPKECLILEDNFNGIKAAQESGAFVMKINDTTEVNYENIVHEIKKNEVGENS